MSVALFSHDHFLLHDTGAHPECAARLQAIETAIEHTELKDKLTTVVPEEIDDETLLAVHSRAHIESMRQFCASGGGHLSLDTTVSTHSYRAARLAAGAAKAAALRSLSGQGPAFAAVRPPGHHATRDMAMGFCLFNNVAVGAVTALEHGAERVFILDWDVHHGNGTEQMFYDQDAVLYCSVHQYPAYPGTGAVTDVGRAGGEGYTVNIPVPPGAGDEALSMAMDTIIIPVVRQYRPDVVLCSAGFDSHYRDPLGGLTCTLSGYGDMLDKLIDVTADICPGKIVVVLEGGYNLEVVGLGSALVLSKLLDETIELPLEQSHPAPDRLWRPHIERAHNHASQYWNLSSPGG